MGWVTLWLSTATLVLVFLRVLVIQHWIITLLAVFVGVLSLLSLFDRAKNPEKPSPVQEDPQKPDAPEEKTPRDLEE